MTSPSGQAADFINWESPGQKIIEPVEGAEGPSEWEKCGRQWGERPDGAQVRLDDDVAGRRSRKRKHSEYEGPHDQESGGSGRDTEGVRIVADKPTRNSRSTKEGVGKDEFDDLVAAWPALVSLRRAASANRPARFRFEVEAMLGSARVAFAAALNAWLSPGLGANSPALSTAKRMYSTLRAAVSSQLEHLATLWHLSGQQASHLQGRIVDLVGGSSAGATSKGKPAAAPASGFRMAHYERVAQEATEDPFPHRTPFFFAALADGWPLMFAVKVWSKVGRGRLSVDGKCCYFSEQGCGEASRREMFAIPSACDGEGVLVVCQGQHIKMILSTVSMALIKGEGVATAGPPAGMSNLLPECIRLPINKVTGAPIFPKHLVTTMYDARENWDAIAGHVMDTTTFAIVNGLLVMPLQAWPTMCVHKPNHASWELDPAAQMALGPTLAKWIAAGNLEQVLKGHAMPLYIEPCGAVAKSTHPFYRLITDGRWGNGIYAPWSVIYHTLKDVALVLVRCDFIFSKDIANAYHSGAFAGCGQGLITEDATFIDARGHASVRPQRFIGCSPRTCYGACDKCFSGIKLFWCIFRFACCQFGKATAHGPLNAYIQCLIRYFAGLPDPISVQAWVDDLLASVRGVVHGLCAVFAGGCATCAENRETAMKAYDGFCAICRQLHVWFSEGKGFEPAQIGEFTGIIIDTVRGLFSVSPEKLMNIVECLSEIRGLHSVSRRMLGRGRGKVGHYAQAIPYLNQVLPTFTQAIGEGVTGEVNWDGHVQLTPRLMLTIDYVISTIRSCGEQGRPMWPLPASSAYKLFLDGGAEHLKVATVVWDSSPEGWGAVIRTRASSTGKLIIGTFEANVAGDFDHQVRRETRGGVLALRAAIREFDLRGWLVILRNDATGALATLRKGCSKSEFMQDQAMEIVTMARDNSIELLFLHAPGKTLIAERVDKASRAGAKEVRGPAITGYLREAVWGLAAELRWIISLDLFASKENCLVPRFFARYAEADAEGVDALAQTSWFSSKCAACGRVHRETVYAFPPQALIPAFIKKASADGVRGILIVPHSVSAPYWSRLRQASVTGTDGPWKSFKNPSKALQHAGSFRPQALAVFALDFGKGAGVTDVSLFPACGQEARARDLPSWELPADAADRCIIDAKLRDLIQAKERETSANQAGAVGT